MLFLETSALDGKNVKKAFETIVDQIYHTYEEDDEMQDEQKKRRESRKLALASRE